MPLTRRSFLTAAVAAQGLVLTAQQTPPAPGRGGSGPTGGKVDPRVGTRDAARLYNYSDRRAKVSLIKGENRRKAAIDDQIRPALRTRKYPMQDLPTTL